MKNKPEDFYQYYETIKLNWKQLNQIHNFTTELVKVKVKTKRHKNDNPKMLYNSWYHAYNSEVSIEDFLGIKFIRWNIEEEADKFGPDLMDLNLPIGVKTSEWKRNFPAIKNSKLSFSKIETPEIITIFKPPDETLICGYATIPVLKYFQNPNYTFGTAYGKKSGFWGYHKLHKFYNLKDLQDLFANKNLDTNEIFTDTEESILFNKKITEIPGIILF